MLFECPAEESHSIFFVTKEKDEVLWEDTSNFGMRT
jgi:hypothetical protein